MATCRTNSEPPSYFMQLAYSGRMLYLFVLFLGLSYYLENVQVKVIPE